MTWIDPDGLAHPVTIISTLGGYAYIQLVDGSTINVRRSQLVDDLAPPRPKPPRHIATPPPAISPKRPLKPEE